MAALHQEIRQRFVTNLDAERLWANVLARADPVGLCITGR